MPTLRSQPRSTLCEGMSRDILVLADSVGNVLDVIGDERRVDFCRFVRGERGVEAVGESVSSSVYVAFPAQAAAGDCTKQNSLDHDDTVNLVLAPPDLIEHLVGDVTGDIVEMPRS
jgi:hypothetical protein